MKVIDIDDEKKLATFYEKRIGNEVEGDVLGEEFKGYVFRCAPSVPSSSSLVSQTGPALLIAGFPVAMTNKGFQWLRASLLTSACAC